LGRFIQRCSRKRLSILPISWRGDRFGPCTRLYGDRRHADGRSKPITSCRPSWVLETVLMVVRVQIVICPQVTYLIISHKASINSSSLASSRLTTSLNNFFPCDTFGHSSSSDKGTLVLLFAFERPQHMHSCSERGRLVICPPPPELVTSTPR
jgi:hypothetical protein